MTTIYTLELEHGKYYVGRSTFPKKRILAHFTTNGSEWTKLHPPVRVISQILGDEFDEEKHTLIAMNTYGVDNVRGGSYCTLTLSKFEKEKAQQTIWSIMDKCYKCGNVGHFAKNCQPVQHVQEEADESIPLLNGWTITPQAFSRFCARREMTYGVHIPGQCYMCNGSEICELSGFNSGYYGKCMGCCCADCGQTNGLNGTCICDKNE